MLAHSLGNYVAVEALRQMAIRDRGLPEKIKTSCWPRPTSTSTCSAVRSPRSRTDKPPPVTLFVSQDDKALGMSQLIAGDEPSLGAVDPTQEPYHGILQQAHVRVVDLTAVATDDPARHSKFASADVVRAIGVRLANGQAQASRPTPATTHLPCQCTVQGLAERFDTTRRCRELCRRLPKSRCRRDVDRH